MTEVISLEEEVSVTGAESKLLPTISKGGAYLSQAIKKVIEWLPRAEKEDTISAFYKLTPGEELARAERKTLREEGRVGESRLLKYVRKRLKDVREYVRLDESELEIVADYMSRIDPGDTLDPFS